MRSGALATNIAQDDVPVVGAEGLALLDVVLAITAGLALLVHSLGEPALVKKLVEFSLSRMDGNYCSG